MKCSARIVVLALRVRRTSRVQRLLKDDQVIPPVAVPTDAADVVAERDRQVKQSAMVIVAFDPHHFVAVLPGPIVDCFHELGRNPMAAEIRVDAVEPGEVSGWLELEAEEETDWLVLYTRQHL